MAGHGAAEVSPEKTKWGRIGRRRGLLAMAPVGIGTGGCGCSWVLTYDQVVPSGTSRRRRWVPLLRIEAGGAREAAATGEEQLNIDYPLLTPLFFKSTVTVRYWWIIVLVSVEY